MPASQWPPPPKFAVSLPGLPVEGKRTSEDARPLSLNSFSGRAYAVGWDPGRKQADRDGTTRYLINTEDFFAWIHPEEWSLDFTPPPDSA